MLKSTPWRRYALYLSLSSLFLLGGCTTRPVPAQTPEANSPPAEAQPPALPVEPANTPLPELGGSVEVSALQALAATSNRVELRLLLVSPTENDAGLAALEALCDQIGIPFETLIATKETLNEARLLTANGDGRYQGVFLTNNQLVYNDDGTYQSAFGADEWNLLWSYERDFGVRQVSLYTFPGTYPEDYGVRVAGYKSTNDAPYPATLTQAGQSVFAAPKQGVVIPIRYAYTYLAAVEPGGVAAEPLITDAAGNALAVTSTAPDGRERLALTMAHSPYLLHTELLGYDLVRWVTRGVFLGERRFYLGLDEDDWFASTDKWNADLHALDGEYRLTAEDVIATKAQQEALRREYPVAASSQPFTFTMAFNGYYADPSAPADCPTDTNPITSPDPLTSVTRCLANDFYWVNHTYTHTVMDAPTSYSTAKNEIAKNKRLARNIGLTSTRGYYAGSLVSGEISGLGWYAPNGVGNKIDFGLEASNRAFLQAARDQGVRYLASNMSVKSHEPDCWGCGTPHPLEPSILLVPRWPTGMFYSTTTPTDLLDAYNRVYGPQGSAPYFDHDLTYDEFLDVDTDIALYHVMTGSPYQHYQHVTNLREYAPGHSLSYDWAERLVEKYSRFYDLPLLTLTWKELGQRVAERTSFRNADATGVWDKTTNRVTLTARNGGVVFATGMNLGARETYGGQTVSKRTFKAGEIRTYRVEGRE